MSLRDLLSISAQFLENFLSLRKDAVALCCLGVFDMLDMWMLRSDVLYVLLIR